MSSASSASPTSPASATSQRPEPAGADLWSALHERIGGRPIVDGSAPVAAFVVLGPPMRLPVGWLGWRLIRRAVAEAAVAAPIKPAEPTPSA